MANYPAYVQRLLAQAREEGQWYCYQTDAAAKCFNVLALFPDHKEATELVYQLFCDEWLIYDNRIVLQRHIDEWDDRPWQQRRRLALSFRFMSRWEDDQQDYEPETEFRPKKPSDVSQLLKDGRGQLLHAYCLGDNECTNRAWTYFEKACCQTKDLQSTLLWIGRQYVDLGFFADAAEVLTELCTKFNDENARHLLAEVRWWRDNAYRIPWIPPAGDGSRYLRMMKSIDPEAPADEEIIKQLRAETGLSNLPENEDTLAPDMAAAITAAVSALDKTAVPSNSPVDWTFLDEDDGQPGELPDWAKKMLRRIPPGGMADGIIHRHRWSRFIQSPAIPPNHNPTDAKFDPSEILPYDDDDDDEWFDYNDTDLPAQF